jgi:uncharacterized glyoxalase superfamily protein PhnB
MKTERLEVVRNDFEPEGNDRRLVLAEMDGDSELLLMPDNPRAGMVAFIQIANDLGSVSLSLDLYAARAIRNALTELIAEGIEAGL